MRARFTSEVNPRVKTLPEMMKLDMRDMNVMAGWVDLEFTRAEKRLFASEGASGGPKWQVKDAAKLLREKVRRGFPGRKIMQRTGKLRRGLTQQGHADHVRESVLRPRATIQVGTRNVVAAHHVSIRDTLQSTRQQDRKYTELIRDYLENVKLERVKRVLSAWRGRRRGVA